MKKNSFLKSLAIVLVIGALFGLAFHAGAQTTNSLPAATIGSADAAATVFTALLAGLAGKYGWLLTVVIWVGVLRTAIKPIMLIIEAVVKATPGESDDQAVSKFEQSAVYKWLIWGLDWLASIKPPTATTTNPLVK